MTTQTYHRQQANRLLETGQCDLPIDWDDIARRVAKSPEFRFALKRAYEGRGQMLDMLVITAANRLCKEQDNGLLTVG